MNVTPGLIYGGQSPIPRGPSAAGASGSVLTYDPTTNSCSWAALDLSPYATIVALDAAIAGVTLTTLAGGVAPTGTLGVVRSNSPTLTTAVNAGVFISRSVAGTPGVQEVQMYYDVGNTCGWVTSKNGKLLLDAATTIQTQKQLLLGNGFTAVGGTSYEADGNGFTVSNSRGYRWVNLGTTTTPNLALIRQADGVLQVSTDGTTGTVGQLIAGNISATSAGSATLRVTLGHDGTRANITTAAGGGNVLAFRNDTTTRFMFNYSTKAIQIGSDGAFQFTSGTDPSSTGPDSGFAREAAASVRVTDGSTGVGSLLSGTHTVRQSGGVAGTNDFVITDAGTAVTLQNKASGTIRFLNSAGVVMLGMDEPNGRLSLQQQVWVTNGTGAQILLDSATGFMRLGSNKVLQWSDNARADLGTVDLALIRNAANVLQVSTDGTTGTYGGLIVGTINAVNPSLATTNRIGAFAASGNGAGNASIRVNGINLTAWSGAQIGWGAGNSATDSLDAWFEREGAASIRAGTAAAVHAFTSGTHTVRQSGGVAGTDEVQISHDGSHGRVRSMDGDLQLRSASGYTKVQKASDGVSLVEMYAFSSYIGTIDIWQGDATPNIRLIGNTGVRLGSNRTFSWSPTADVSAAGDTVLGRVAAGVFGGTTTAASFGSPAVGTAGLTVNTIASQTAKAFRVMATDGTTELMSVNASGEIVAAPGSITVATPGISFRGLSTSGFAALGTTVAVWCAGVQVANISSGASGAYRVPSDIMFAWASSTTNTTAPDTALVRVSAGTVKITNGSSGLGALQLADITVGSGGTALQKILSATATLDFPSTAAQTSSDLTIGVTGAAVGDVVSLGTPVQVANCSFSAFVSAADTVTVRLNNYSAGAIDPTSGTFRVQVTKF